MNAAVLHRYITAALVLAAGAQASASEWRVSLDPLQTRVSFTLKATMHTVHGKAQLVSGSLVIDTETGAVDGEIVIDASSANTANKGRDKKMHGKVLLSGDHPRIVLRPTRIDGEFATGSDSTVTLAGELDLLNTKHPISIPLLIRIDGPNFKAVAEFTVPYVEWGLKDPSTFVLRVAKEVQVQVTTEGSIAVDNQAR